MSWGSNAAGVAWEIAPGYEADFSASLGRGRVVSPSTDVFRMAYLPYAIPGVDLTVNVQTNQVATGERINGIVAVRSSATGDEVQARVEFGTAGTYSISLYDVVSGAYSAIGWEAGIATYAASSPVMIRLQVADTWARLKTWPLATSEPDHWQVVGPTAVIGPGKVGLGAILSTGCTNANPEVSYGALSIPNPQQFTVVRSANGIVKAHGAGTSLSLAYPSVVAL